MRIIPAGESAAVLCNPTYFEGCEINDILHIISHVEYASTYDKETLQAIAHVSNTNAKYWNESTRSELENPNYAAYRNRKFWLRSYATVKATTEPITGATVLERVAKCFERIKQANEELNIFTSAPAPEVTFTKITPTHVDPFSLDGML